eukprot:542110_1
MNGSMVVQTPTYAQYFRQYQIVEWRSFYVHYEQHKQIINRLYSKDESHDNIELIQQRIRQDIVKVDDFFMIQLDLSLMMKDNYDKHINVKSGTNLSTLMELIAKLFNLYMFVWHNYTAFTKLINQIDLISKQITLRNGYEEEKIDTLGSSTPSPVSPETPKTPKTPKIQMLAIANKYNNLQNELRNMKMMKKHRNLRDTIDICLTKFYENQTITQNHYNKIQSIICQHNTNLAQAMSNNVLSKSISIVPWFYQHNPNTKVTQSSTRAPIRTSSSKNTLNTSTNTFHTKITSIPSGEDLDYSEHDLALAMRIQVDRPTNSAHIDRPITAHTDRSHENLSDLWPEFSETRIDCDDTKRFSGRTSRTRTKENLHNLKIRTSLITPNGFSPYTTSINNSHEIQTPPASAVSIPIPETNQCKHMLTKHYGTVAISMILYCVSIGIYPFMFKYMSMDRTTNMTLIALISSCQWPVWLILWICLLIYRMYVTRRRDMVSNRVNIPLHLVYSGSGNPDSDPNGCAHTECPVHPTAQSNISLFTVYRRIMNYCSQSTLFNLLCNRTGVQMIAWSAFMDGLQIVFELVALYKLDGIIYLCIAPLLSFTFHLLIIYPILDKDYCAQMCLLLSCCAIQIALSYWYGAYDMLWGTLSLIACHILSSCKAYLIFNRDLFMEKDLISACNFEYFVSFSFMINLLTFVFILACMMTMYQDIQINYQQLSDAMHSEDYVIICCLFLLMMSKIGTKLIKYVLFSKDSKNKFLFLLLNTDNNAYYNGDLVAVSLLDVASRTVWFIAFIVLLNEQMSMILVAAWINICFVIYISYKLITNSLFSHDTFSWLTFVHSSYTSLAPHNMDSILLAIAYKFYSNFKLYMRITNNRFKLSLNRNGTQSTPNNHNNVSDEINKINDSVELYGINKTKEQSQTETIPTPVPTVDNDVRDSNDDNESTAL